MRLHASWVASVALGAGVVWKWSYTQIDSHGESSASACAASPLITAQCSDGSMPTRSWRQPWGTNIPNRIRPAYGPVQPRESASSREGCRWCHDAVFIDLSASTDVAERTSAYRRRNEWTTLRLHRGLVPGDRHRHDRHPAHPRHRRGALPDHGLAARTRRREPRRGAAPREPLARGSGGAAHEPARPRAHRDVRRGDDRGRARQRGRHPIPVARRLRPAAPRASALDARGGTGAGDAVAHEAPSGARGRQAHTVPSRSSLRTVTTLPPFAMTRSASWGSRSPAWVPSPRLSPVPLPVANSMAPDSWSSVPFTEVVKSNQRVSTAPSAASRPIAARSRSTRP